MKKKQIRAQKDGSNCSKETLIATILIAKGFSIRLSQINQLINQSGKTIFCVKDGFDLKLNALYPVP